MKEGKIDFDPLIVGYLFLNRGHAQIIFSPLALIGAEIIGEMGH